MITVTAGIIMRDDRILIAKRKEGKHLAGYWEFPGGKIHVDETAEACMIRELKEELDVEVKDLRPFHESQHHYKEKSIKLISFIVGNFSGKITAQDHEEILWVSKSELLNYKLAPADIPIAEKLTAL